VGKGATTKRRPASRRAAVRPRSISASDEDWRAVEEFAQRRGLGSTSDAARVLLRTGLQTQSLVDEFAAAQQWQIAQAWADAQRIADGDREVGSWERIREAGERARTRVRQRAAENRSGAGG
jgi:hypothetical protein